MEINDFYSLDLYGRNDTVESDVTFQLYKLVEIQTIFTYCKPSCMWIDLTLERIVHKPHLGESVVEIYWPTTVEVKTTAYSFDKFALAVELGSSLGLWLGLSALSFFDIALLCCRNRSLLCRFV